jgi:hypothetical protein
MAKFNPPKKLIIDEFGPDQKPWIGKLVDPLNNFMAQVATALTQGIVFSDNTKSLTIPLNIAISQAYPMVFNASALKERPTSIHVARVYPVDESIMTAAFSVHWEYKDGTIYYTLLGLDGGKAYKGYLHVIV